ncbi:MAG: hypothetical protein KC731_17415, partial [Myxococcales bacterium]|nr:hypothetical protein [Myxococcales bacterium]
TRVTAALGLFVVTGWVLGWPLTTGARLLVADERPTVAWAWGAHLAGWGFGGGLAALVALYAGIPAVMVVGVGAFLVGAALMLIGSRRLPA